MITTTYALICFNFFWNFFAECWLQNQMFQNKDKLIFIYVLYQIVKYLSIFFVDYFCIIYIIFLCYFLMYHLSPIGLFPRQIPPLRKACFFPEKLSLRLGCSKIQANIPEGIS